MGCRRSVSNEVTIKQQKVSKHDFFFNLFAYFAISVTKLRNRKVSVRAGFEPSRFCFLYFAEKDAVSSSFLSKLSNSIISIFLVHIV